MDERPLSLPRLPCVLRLLYDRRDRRHQRVVAAVHAADCWDQVELIDVADAGTGSAPLRLITSDGEVLTGYALFRRLVRTLRLLWPAAVLTWLPGAAALGRRWYPGEALPLVGGEAALADRRAPREGAAAPVPTFRPRDGLR